MSTAAQNLTTNSAFAQTSPVTSVHNDRLDSFPWLPCALTVEIPVIHFTIANLLGLKEGAIVETGFHHTSDLPLRANQLLIAWTEFEVVGDRLAVRITEQL